MSAEQDNIETQRVYNLLDPKPNDLKTPKRFVKEGPLMLVEKKKKTEVYLFVFHTIIFITKPKGNKYKIEIAIGNKPNLRVFDQSEETEGETNDEPTLSFTLDAIKKQFEFEATSEDEKNEWIKLLSQNIDGEFDPMHIKPSFIEVNGETVWDVRAELSADQLTIFDEFKTKVLNIPNLSEYILHWLTDDCLYRFLRAREWNVAASFAMIENTIKWREQNKPDQIQLNEIDKVVQTGDLYISTGRDLKGRIIVYMRPGKTPDHPDIRAQYVRHMAWIVENISKSMDAGHTAKEKSTWIVDFAGCKIQGGVEENITMSKQTIDILQCHYPERLGMCFILNPPLPFFVLWKVVSTFIDPATRHKVQFLRKKSDQAKLLQYIAQDQLEELYGGHIPSFSFDEYVARFFS